MRHLLSHTIYGGTDVFGADAESFLGGIRADGVELLTSYEEPDPFYKGVATSVHLPYATDWLSAWEGRPYDLRDDQARYYMFGRDRDEIVAAVTDSIEKASVLSPAYGVFHASNGAVKDLWKRSSGISDERVLKALAEMMNRVASGFSGGEPPFRIMFENLWWPGLRLLDDSGFRVLQDRLEFDDWGLCLDTGHLMNCLPGIRTEKDGIDALREIFMGYPQDLIGRIGTVHFHWSASWEYRSSFEEKELTEPVGDFIASAYPHICSIDQHMPFSDPSCADLLRILKPDYATHELPGSWKSTVEDYIRQRAALDSL